MKEHSIPILLAVLVGFSACGSPQSESRDMAATDETERMDTQEQPEVNAMENGLQIQVIAEGKGEGLSPGQFVRMHYTGWLYDENAPDGRGNKFDSSRDLGETFDYQHGVTRLIAGWTQGSEGMRTGERRILTIPAELGYGTGGSAPRIPPNATLIFDIELVEIVGQ